MTNYYGRAGVDTVTNYYGGAPLSVGEEAAAYHDTDRVLQEIHAERRRQRAKYGLNRDLADGTGPEVRWLDGGGVSLDVRSAAEIEHRLRTEYMRWERDHGRPTWMHLVREEVAEAFAEDDPVRLREELLQVAALCVSWVETLDARSRPSAAQQTAPLPRAANSQAGLQTWIGGAL